MREYPVSEKPLLWRDLLVSGGSHQGSPYGADLGIDRGASTAFMDVAMFIFGVASGKFLGKPWDVFVGLRHGHESIEDSLAYFIAQTRKASRTSWLDWLRKPRWEERVFLLEYSDTEQAEWPLWYLDRPSWWFTGRPMPEAFFAELSQAIEEALRLAYANVFARKAKQLSQATGAPKLFLVWNRLPDLVLKEFRETAERLGARFLTFGYV